VRERFALEHMAAGVELVVARVVTR
jgi:hypothetical protein